MGSGLSVEENSMLYVDAHGALGLKETYVAPLEASMDLDIKRPLVTKEHEALIHKHWAVVCRGTSAFQKEKHLTPTKFFASTFYATLFKAAPGVRPMFRSSMTVQGKALTGLVATLATVIKANNVAEVCINLARMHAQYGATRAHYTGVGLALLETLQAVSANEWSTEIRTAYLTSYCLLYYLMLPTIIETPRRPLQPSLPGHIARKERLAHGVMKLSIALDFPLRYHAGDSILLGLPLPNGEEVRRSYALTSLFDPSHTNAIDICVEARGDASQWLVDAPIETVLNVYWINTGVHFETDTFTSIPHRLLFVSHGLGAAPVYAMVKGLYAIRSQYEGDICMLQVFEESPIPYFQSVCSDGPWSSLKIATATTLTQEALLELAPDVATRHLYVAGPPAFVDATSRLFLENGGDAQNLVVYSFDNTPFLADAASV
ncbi:hypothetical protein SPRG_12378 [Saprolegnia parasitica CBS 223.65]|uniref:FAD-binding FR-type domain-containing protein n=1 Tax=Saprolegnia parasitica (strain CBS 223.65) TaxID=695850 RepID=A0A067C5P9_SAPPC|nr:hypothetical protein SPRG_12378 [Saprolegnia parasitica CBS 223.65]KDO21876.1 hypothetical protein SPRG_12378 [Saprolegnia parasitica CBS 223.65]|eukprot:XP_012207431.1 hypothetical protein SPRG_12378 [Saprolegnia parasitica CBS 223.65]